jgi:6-phosphogluconolactonase (cycloisomerase 2 family)
MLRSIGSVAFLALFMVGCGGGGASSPPPPATYTVGGTVTGLSGSGLLLSSDFGGDLAVSASGAFMFSTRLPAGGTYKVVVKNQPTSPAQTCQVTHGAGTIVADVTNVAVSCQSGSSSTIGGGTVSGLVGSGLVLQLVAPIEDSKYSLEPISKPLQINSNGPFAFTIADIIDLQNYQFAAHVFIKIVNQPSSPTQSCVLQHAANGATFADVGCSQFAYVANTGDNTVSAYTVDASTGALAAIGAPAVAGASPSATFGVEYSGKRLLYVANEHSNDISAFAVDAITGALTAVPGSPFAAGTDPQAMALVPALYLYVVNAGSDNVSAYSIDDSTGTLAPLSPGPSTIATGKSPTSIVVGPGSFIYVANHGGSNDISAFSNPSPGVLTPLPGSPFPAGGNPLSLALGAGGKFLYTANPDATHPSISGFSIDPTSGVLSPLSGSPFPLSVSHYIATDQTGAYLYVTSGASIVGYAIDATTGALTALPGFPVAAGANAYSVSVDLSNQHLYVANDSAANISGFTLDASTGALTPMAGSPFPAGQHPDFLTTSFPSFF